MAEWNSSQHSPFLLYVTVFRSRLGIANVALPLASLSATPEHELLRRLRIQLDHRNAIEVSAPENDALLSYLVEKGMVGKQPRKSGRYAAVSLRRSEAGGWEASLPGDAQAQRINVYQTDIWMAESGVPSTIGVPTPDNAPEVLEFCNQLGLLAAQKGSWTSAGHLVAQLRTLAPSPNPFQLGPEVSALLRQLLAVDSLLLRELLRDLPTQFSRDDIVRKLPAIARRAAAQLTPMNLAVPARREVARYLALLDQSASKAEARDADEDGGARGPGVLEHRTAPRLEWLVDLGALSKPPSARNAFRYQRTDDLDRLAIAMDHHPADVSSISLEYWRSSDRWRPERSNLPTLTVRDALVHSYRLLRRPVGPAPIAEVIFAAALHSPESSLEALRGELISWAANETRITLAGGRFTKELQSVHFRDELL